MTRHAPELGRARTARWVLITGTAQALRVFLGIASAAILARLLRPEDFGLVAMTAPILALVIMVQSLGLNQALVQHPDLSRHQINALFYITLGLSSALAGLLYVSASTVAWFFEEPRLIGLIEALSLLTLISAAASTPIGLLNRRLQFTALAVTELSSALIGLIAGVAFAYFTRSYWALIVMQGITSLAQLLSAMAWSRWVPGQARFTAAVREMIGFGAGFSTFNLLNFLSRNMDKLLIAKVYGAVSLGFYDRAYKLMLDPLTQALMPLGRVLIPVLARLKDEPDAYRQRYIETATLLMAVTQPALLITIVFPESVIRILLGAQWDGAAAVFQWLALTSVHQIFTSTIGWLFISQARGRDFAVLGGYSSAIAVASFVVGLRWGPVGVAAAYAIADYVLRVPFTWWIAGRRGPVSTLDILSAFWPHAFAMVVAGVILVALKMFYPEPGLVGLAMLSAVSFAIYAPALLCFRSKRVFALSVWRVLHRRLRARMM